jgi:hypothetical protein
MSFPKKPLELYTHAVDQALSGKAWRAIARKEFCWYLEGRCDKNRKSEPDLTIGTCTVGYMGKPTIICPHRFLQERQVFIDAIHLLEQHQPGNQLHVIPEIEVPGGSIDYIVASVYRGEIKDYLGLEIQALDTTGTVWPARQALLSELTGASVPGSKSSISYGINWKMSAKTILIQMHHKVETFERLGKKLILAIQDIFFDYMTREFTTSGLRSPKVSDPAHFHVYQMQQDAKGAFSIELKERTSTTTVGIEQMLGLGRTMDIPESDLLARIQSKISDTTLLQI